MNLSLVPIWAVDVVGSVLMILFACVSCALSLRLKRKAPNDILLHYLVWICLALFLFAISRAAGHLLRQVFLLTGQEARWLAIQPFSGAVNTITFILVGSFTLFFERTWVIYGTILKDRQALQAAHGELLSLNQNLEQRVNHRTAALLASEQRYRRIFELSQDIILVARLDGEIVTLNPAGRQMLGLSATDGQTVHPGRFQAYLARPQQWDELHRRIAAYGFLANEEVDLTLPGGVRRRALLSASLAQATAEETETIHFLVKDIEQRRLLQKQVAQADKLASIGELASGIAHEINNPLGIILGYTQLLLRGEDPRSDRYNDLKVIEKHVKSCKGIVENLLNFARTAPARKENREIHGVIDDAIGFVRHHSDLEGIRIDIHYQAGLPPVHIDANQIKQVLINLLMNAIHAMNRRGTLRVDTALDTDARQVTVAVTDTGHGIAKTDLPRIFDPFFTTKPTGEGTGLGLSVSYGIVKGHGGSIIVKSEPDRGATFIVSLPAAPPTED